MAKDPFKKALKKSITNKDYVNKKRITTKKNIVVEDKPPNTTPDNGDNNGNDGGDAKKKLTAREMAQKGAEWAGKIAEAGTFGDLAAMSKGVPTGPSGNVVDKSDHITKVREGINYKQIAKSGETLDDWIKRTA